MTAYDDLPVPASSAEPTRAEQRFSGLVGPRRPRSDEENEALTHVTLDPSVWGQLQRYLDAPGRAVGGLIYGSRCAGLLRVRQISAGGPSGWLQAHPLDMRSTYVLGYTACLRDLMGDQVYWTGQWMMRADRRLPPLEVDRAWLRRGAPDRLLDAEHPLLVIGYEDGARTVRAHRLEDDTDEPARLVYAGS